MPPKTNSAPVAVHDHVEMPVGGVIEIPVLANDRDADGDPLKIVAFTLPAHGSLTSVANDTFRYTPAPDYVGDDAFTYTIRDPGKGLSTASVTISVQAPNAAPSAVADAVTTVRDVPVTFDARANDDDPDGDPLRITDHTSPAHGGLVLNADQTFTYAPARGFTGADAFTYRIADGRGGTAEARVELTVIEPNAPPVATSDHATTVQNTAIRLDLLANDADPDGDALTIVGVSVPTHGIVSVHADQTVTYTPSANFLGTDAFTYTVADGRGGTSSVVATIEVVPPNRAPTSIVIDATTVSENAAGAVVGKLTVSDPDAGDVHRFTVDDARFEVVDGALKLKAGEALDAEVEPEVTLTVTATDSGGLSYSQAFTLTVSDVNEAPTALALDATTVAENATAAVVGNLTVTDPDVDDVHRFAVDDARFEVVDGALKLKAGEALDAEAEPEVKITVTATDAAALSYSQTFTLTVADVNEAPTAVALDATTVEENAAGAVVGNLTVTDPDAGDVHRFTVDDARFEVVEGALKLKAGEALDAEAEPEVTLTVTATDAGGLSYSQVFTVTVSDVEEAPTAVDDAATTVANSSVEVDVLANDTDPARRPLSLVAVATPTTGAAAIVDGRAVYEPAYGFVGRDRFAYTVANDLGLEDEAVVTVDVAGHGEPFADGTFFTDGTGWLDSVA